ncbi:MAG: hypothetical protein M4579_005256 [Chaenotheca gracillima]|nr:MAG: hypothetical protein M4579_005256 [Chaenotheca gracillima]
MNPHQKNKVDISERKYFDSGDYAMSKAGKADEVGVNQIGSQHPSPESIPHLSSPGTNNGMNPGNGNGHAHGQGPIPSGQSGSPVKESSFLYRQTSVDDQEDGSAEQQVERQRTEDSVSPPPAKEGMPIRT